MSDPWRAGYARVDSIWQVFVAPLFLMVEVFAMLGWKRDVLPRAEECNGVRPG